MKRIFAVILAAVFCMTAIPAFADWENSGGRYWYSYADGGYAANEWIQDGAWYYMDGDGWMATGWKQIGGSWFYFGAGGAMATGWQQIDGSWYYFDASGAMMTGWRRDGSSWYYLSPSGVMATGWQKIGSNWYYMNQGGDMATGWHREGNVWYYLDDGGVMTTGWKQEGGSWYYLDESGMMTTGWKQIGGSWFYFGDGGIMTTGWKEIDGGWFYFGPGGDMATGWKTIDNDMYYFKADGTMVTGDYEIDGETYHFGEDGKCKVTLKLIIWSFTNEFQGMIEKYYAPTHPDIEFEFEVYPTDGNVYMDKLDNALTSAADSDEAPDIFTIEAGFVKEYTNSDWTADLKEVGFTDEELSVAFPVMAEIGTDSRNNTQKGLSWQSTPGVLMYRASLAEKYLGVKTPEEFQALVKDWDSFLATARKLKEASDGECKMVSSSGDLWNVYQYQRDKGWDVNGELNIDDVLLDFEEMCKAMYEEDLTQKSGTWNEEWYAGMNGKLETLCYFLPTWGLHYTIKPNCVEGGYECETDEELAAKSEAEGGTYGDWRLTEGPVAYSWGGTWITANEAKVKDASATKKEAIHDLISYMTLDDGFLLQYAKDTGDFVGSSKAVETILADGGTPNPFLGGQNHYAIFAKSAALADGTLMTEYDNDLTGLWSDYVTGPYQSGECDLETAIANFKGAVAAMFPELKVK